VAPLSPPADALESAGPAPSASCLLYFSSRCLFSFCTKKNCQRKINQKLKKPMDECIMKNVSFVFGRKTAIENDGKPIDENNFRECLW
jgi:hypothetical protein